MVATYVVGIMQRKILDQWWQTNLTFLLWKYQLSLVVHL